MELFIHTQDFALQPQVEKYLREKFAKFEELIHQSGAVSRFDVYLKKVGHQESGDILNLSLRVKLRTRQLFTEESGADIFALIDAVQQEMLTQLRKEKEKPLARVKRGAARFKEWLRFGLSREK